MAGLYLTITKWLHVPAGLEVLADDAILHRALADLSGVVSVLVLTYLGLRAYNGIRDEWLRAQMPPKPPR
jgi:hypothetical protein